MSNPTEKEKSHWSRVASIGCIACLIDGNFNPVVSIHHTDGRTKTGAHMKVLPLCASHHQDGTGNDKSAVAIHPWKARFQERYGNQNQLLVLTDKLLATNSEDFSLTVFTYLYDLFGELR